MKAAVKVKPQAQPVPQTAPASRKTSGKPDRPSRRSAKPTRQREQPLPYSDDRAQALVEISQIAYQDGQSAVQKFHDRGFDKFYFFSKADTEAFLVGNASQIIIIFRGTEPKSVQDWLTNAQVLKTQACGGRIHSGFWQSTQAIWAELEGEIRRIRGEFPTPPPLFLTGHSLGGALAMLTASELQRLEHKVDGVYTFGAPRIGDRHFAMQYNRRLYDQTFRLVNHRDIVTQLPPAELNYTHVGQLIYFDAQGQRQLSPFPQTDHDFAGIDGFYDHDLRAYHKSLEHTQTAQSTPAA
jgi:triacylglycerol lipase